LLVELLAYDLALLTQRHNRSQSNWQSLCRGIDPCPYRARSQGSEDLMNWQARILPLRYPIIPRSGYSWNPQSCAFASQAKCGPGRRQAVAEGDVQKSDILWRNSAVTVKSHRKTAKISGIAEPLSIY